MGFRYTQYQPSPELRPFVCGYGFFTSLGPGPAAPRRGLGDDVCEMVMAAGDPIADWLLPCVQAHLNFNLGEPFGLCRDGGDVPVKERSHAVGPVTRPGRVRLPDPVEFLGVLFRPGCAHLFLRVPADELTDQFVGLEHFWGPRCRELEGRLLKAAGDRERIRLVEAELLRRLAEEPAPDRAVPAIADHIVRGRGAVTVERLSAACGFTRQHLARKFRHALGVSPKLFCRLVRFQNAFARIAGSPPGDWARAAVELGYYDQSHLIAEFKEFTGLTPTGFSALR
jgi:AraC-like DNA-binding protein